MAFILYENVHMSVNRMIDTILEIFGGSRSTCGEIFKMELLK